MKKMYRNWFIHNVVSHPLSEICFWPLRLLFGFEAATELAGKIHDFSLPQNPENGRR